MAFFFLTSSDMKFREAQRLLPGIRRLRVSLPELQELSVEKVAAKKAELASEMFKGRKVMVEDTGLYVEAWNGFPGALAKWAAYSIGNIGICRALDGKERGAYAKTCIAVCMPEGIKLFSGRLDGTIAAMPRGKKGFGFDEIFVPEGSRKTLAELSEAEKDMVSHRRKAFAKVVLYLDKASDTLPPLKRMGFPLIIRD